MRVRSGSLMLAAGIALAALVAACNGGSVNAPPFTGGTLVPTPTPTGTPTPSPGPVGTTVPVPSAGGSITLATLGGFTPTFQIAAGAPAGTTMSATESLGPPAGAPAPSALRRTAAVAGATPIFFVTFTLSQTVSSRIFAGEILALASGSPASAQYYVEFDDVTSPPGTKIASFGPATTSGSNAQFTNTGGGGGTTPNLLSGHTYLCQFYYVSAPSPSPTPTATPTSAPSTTPSPTPSPTPATTPTPSPSPTPTVTPTPTPTPTVTPTPSPTPTVTPTPVPNFTFSGSPQSATFNSTGPNVITSGPYQNFTLTTTWGSYTPAGNTTFTQSLATGSGDISPSGFPPNTGNGNVVMYFRFSATPGVTFATTPDVVGTMAAPGSFGGTTCYLYSLNGTLSSPVWNRIIGPQTPSGNPPAVHFPAQTLSMTSVDVSNPSAKGAVYISLDCS